MTEPQKVALFFVGLLVALVMAWFSCSPKGTDEEV